MSYSVIGSEFSDWVRERIEMRNEELANRQDLNIEIDQEFFEIIKNSTAVSTTTGSSAHLLRIGNKRRRTRAEIEEFRQLQKNQ